MERGHAGGEEGKEGREGGTDRVCRREEGEGGRMERGHAGGEEGGEQGGRYR